MRNSLLLSLAGLVLLVASAQAHNRGRDATLQQLLMAVPTPTPIATYGGSGRNPQGQVVIEATLFSNRTSSWRISLPDGAILKGWQWQAPAKEPVLKHSLRPDIQEANVDCPAEKLATHATYVLQQNDYTVQVMLKEGDSPSGNTYQIWSDDERNLVLMKVTPGVAFMGACIVTTVNGDWQEGLVPLPAVNATAAPPR